MKEQTVWRSILSMDDALYWATRNARRALHGRNRGVTLWAVAWDSTATPRRAR